MAEGGRPERVVTGLLIAILVIVGGVSLRRATSGRFDFHHFYLDARYVWEHGALNPDLDAGPRDERRQLPFYLPAVPALLSPVTMLGRTGAACVWAAAQVAALGYGLSVLRRWASRSGERAPAVMLVATLLALPAMFEAAKFNQLSYFVLALVLGAVDQLDRGRWWVAGLWLGLAATVKLLPGVFLPWLLLKRKWAAAGAMLVASVAVAVVPCLVVFGPARTREYHQQWWAYNARGDSAGGLLNAELPDHFIDHRNQSIVQVVARLMWPEHPFRSGWQPFGLSGGQCMRLGYGITALLAVALWWSTRRSWGVLPTERRHAEAAVYAIGMLVFSPLMRLYYLIWALPALVLSGMFAASNDGRQRRLGWMGLGVWTAGMLTWLWPAARLHGAHLLMLVLLGVLVLRAGSLERGVCGLGKDTV